LKCKKKKIVFVTFRIQFVFEDKSLLEDLKQWPCFNISFVVSLFLLLLWKQPEHKMKNGNKNDKKLGQRSYFLFLFWSFKVS